MTKPRPRLYTTINLPIATRTLPFANISRDDEVPTKQAALAGSIIRAITNRSDESSSRSDHDDDDDDDSVHDTLRTCIEEGYLNSEILTSNSKRKRKRHGADVLGLVKKRKSKRQRDKKRKIEQEQAIKKRECDLTEIHLRPTLTSRMEQYFTEQYGYNDDGNSLENIASFSGGNDEKGYLGDILIAAFELDSHASDKSNISVLNKIVPESSKKRQSHRSKSGQNRSPRCTPSHRNQQLGSHKFDANEQDSSDDGPEDGYTKEAVDIDDYVQQQAEVIASQHQNDNIQELSLRALANKSKSSESDTLVSVTVVVGGKVIADIKGRCIIQRKTDKQLASAKKGKLSGSKKSPQNRDKLVSTVVSPVNLFTKKRVREEKHSIPNDEQPDIKGTHKKTYSSRIASKDILSDSDMYREYFVAECKSILDWKRQVQWGQPNKKRDLSFRRRPPFSRDHQIHVASCIKTTQLLYQPHIPKQPSSLEAPRNRHKDSTYAQWCNQLLHCLSSSGRNMVLHEWFYCDIDRGWFNDSTFLDQVEEVVGITRGTKLSRYEWSLVRQKATRKQSDRRNQRRRFSKHFLSAQLNELDDFRSNVRNIQFWRDDVELLPPSKYDIAKIIPVGATVTANNKSARLLHRGLILDRDCFEGILRYRVQFERKELGWEYCADIDVASHGPPNIILPADGNVSNLDGSNRNNYLPGKHPYGTAYGPLIDSHKDINYKVIEKFKENRNRLSRRATATSTSDGDIDADIVIQRVEREVLTKLIDIYDSLLLRKEILLDSIDAFQESFSSSSTLVGPNDEVGLLESYQDHYEWLQRSLQETNSSIRAMLIHMRVMYGSAYLDRYHSDKIVKSAAQIKKPPVQKERPILNRWISSVYNDLDSIANIVVNNILEDDVSIISAPENQYSNDIITNLLTSSANTLLTCELCAFVVGNELMKENEEYDYYSLDMITSLLKLSTMKLRSSSYVSQWQSKETRLALDEIACAIEIFSQELNF